MYRRCSSAVEVLDAVDDAAGAGGVGLARAVVAERRLGESADAVVTYCDLRAGNADVAAACRRRRQGAGRERAPGTVGLLGEMLHAGDEALPAFVEENLRAWVKPVRAVVRVVLIRRGVVVIVLIFLRWQLHQQCDGAAAGANVGLIGRVGRVGHPLGKLALASAGRAYRERQRGDLGVPQIDHVVADCVERRGTDAHRLGVGVDRERHRDHSVVDEAPQDLRLKRLEGRIAVEVRSRT